MCLVVVYVGACAVLFLFVCMMLDINFVELRQGFIRYLPIGAAVGLVLLAELILITGAWTVASDLSAGFAAPAQQMAAVPNTQAIGGLLYPPSVYMFQARGVILPHPLSGANGVDWKTS